MEFLEMKQILSNKLDIQHKSMQELLWDVFLAKSDNTWIKVEQYSVRRVREFNTKKTYKKNCKKYLNFLIDFILFSSYLY